MQDIYLASQSYKLLSSLSVSVDDASLGLKKTIFDKLMQLERLQEEEAILVEEMKRHWSHICRTIKNVNEQTDALSDGLATKSKCFCFLRSH